MKILHTSDIHLDSPLTTRLSADKVRTRKKELLSSFRRCVELAVRSGAQGFIISGDLFDSEKASRMAVETALSIIADAPTVSFFYLFGNHERDMLIRSGLEIPKNALSDYSEKLLVTPKDIDVHISDMGRILGYAINTVLQKDITIEEMDEFLS